MKNNKSVLLILIVLLVVFGVLAALRAGGISTNKVRTPNELAASSTATLGVTTGKAETTTAQQAKQLVEAYPDTLMLDPDDNNVIVWKKDGTRMQFDDGIRGKDLETMLTKPDLQDQMAMPYAAGEKFTTEKDYDPGRVRFEPFFKKMYGATEAEVKANLETIYWLPSFGNQPLLATRVNGVSKKLQTISNELDRLVQQPGKSYLLPYLKDPGGTFKWRNIAGTDRLSPHSFGIAIDINAAHSDYWQWSIDSGVAHHDQIPMEIVQVFEKYGFIWGGKWYHYDSMHFEYRPELLMNE